MKKIKMATVYGDCIKLKNMYYDTDSALKYANIHGGYTMKREDTAKRRAAEIAFINRLYGKRGETK